MKGAKPTCRSAALPMAAELRPALARAAGRPMLLPQFSTFSLWAQTVDPSGLPAPLAASERLVLLHEALRGRGWFDESALWGIAAGVYLALMGPQGMRDLGETVALRTRYGLNLLAVSRNGQRSKSRLRTMKIQAGDLLSIQLGNKGQRVPVWQLDPLKRQLVQAILRQTPRGVDTWDIYHALLRPHDALGGVPPKQFMPRLITTTAADSGNQLSA